MRPAPPSIGTRRTRQPRPRLKAICFPSGVKRGGRYACGVSETRFAQARYHAPAREYLGRKRAEGKSRREALRCLKRLLVRIVFNTLKTDPALT